MLYYTRLEWGKIYIGVMSQSRGERAPRSQSALLVQSAALLAVLPIQLPGSSVARAARLVAYLVGCTA